MGMSCSVYKMPRYDYFLLLSFSIGGTVGLLPMPLHWCLNTFRIMMDKFMTLLFYVKALKKKLLAVY